MENRWSQVASFSNSRNTVCVTVNRTDDRYPRYSIQVGRPLAELDDQGNPRLSRSIQVRLDTSKKIVELVYSITDDVAELIDEAEEWILKDRQHLVDRESQQPTEESKDVSVNRRREHMAERRRTRDY